MTPDEVHRLGLSEVKRIRDEMQLIIDELEFDGSFADFLHFLRTDPQFYYDTPEELFEGYLAVSKRLDPELVKLFGKLPHDVAWMRSQQRYCVTVAPNGDQVGEPVEQPEAFAIWIFDSKAAKLRQQTSCCCCSATDVTGVVRTTRVHKAIRWARGLNMGIPLGWIVLCKRHSSPHHDYLCRHKW